MATPRVRLLAYQEVQGALRRGELKRPSRCSECGGRGNIQAHHDDHAEPLNVRWLCAKCNCRERWIASMGNQMDKRLWARVRAKAKAEGVSLRALILRLLTEWLER